MMATVGAISAVDFSRRVATFGRWQSIPTVTPLLGLLVAQYSAVCRARRPSHANSNGDTHTYEYTAANANCPARTYAEATAHTGTAPVIWGAHASRVLAKLSRVRGLFFCIQLKVVKSAFWRDAAATDAKRRPGFQTSTRDACATPDTNKY